MTISGREGLDGQPRALSSFSGKGIRDRQAFELLSILKVFTVKGVALAFDCGRNDQGIVPGQAEPAADPQGLAVYTKIVFDGNGAAMVRPDGWPG